MPRLTLIVHIHAQAFKESPYMRMVKNSAFPKRFNGSKLTKKHHKEAALMSQAHAAALQASAARAAAAEKESSVIGWNNVDDASIRANKIARLEIELYKTIIVRESLVGRAATLSAALMSGDKKALGSFNPQLLENNQYGNN